MWLNNFFKNHFLHDFVDENKRIIKYFELSVCNIRLSVYNIRCCRNELFPVHFYMNILNSVKASCIFNYSNKIFGSTTGFSLNLSWQTFSSMSLNWGGNNSLPTHREIKWTTDSGIKISCKYTFKRRLWCPGRFWREQFRISSVFWKWQSNWVGKSMAILCKLSEINLHNKQMISKVKMHE